MKENASRGFYNGGNIPYGYKAKKVMDNGNQKTKLEIDEVKAPVVKKIFNLCLKGEGSKDITKYLNQRIKNYPPISGVWTKTKVLYILKNEIYTGDFIWNRKNSKNGVRQDNPEGEIIRIKDTHPSIIPKEDFQRVQTVLLKRSPSYIHPRSIGGQHLLNGLVYCKICKKLYTPCSAKSGKFHYYTCQSSYKSGSDICGTKMACPGYSGIETCPACGLKYEYEESVFPIFDDETKQMLAKFLISRKGR